MGAKYMEDPSSACLMSQALGNARKGYLVQPREPEACDLSQCFGSGRALELGIPGVFKLFSLSPAVPQLRTRDVSYFRDVPGAHGYLARIRPVQPSHGGTFSCVITHDQRPLARLYFFLNGTGAARI